ncbi:MAG: winged helix DNA-binding domain-containing protein, partial [Anaerolineales bacterium]|nr:winged helix DNA-binding domain-containing protein [Anaerolineales bacterium]
PIHERMMRHYGHGGGVWSKRLHKWVNDNESFKQYILNEIDQRGPLLTKDFDDQSKVPWESGGWSTGRSVAYMIDYLWTKGEIFVSQRDGLKRWWDLSHRVMPEWAPDGGWSAEQVTRDAAQKSLK